VSAIGCVLNLEAWVGETLLSLRRQTFKEFEAIYVDDGSTDTTKRILMHYAQLDPRFKYAWVKHGGCAKALNLATKIAVGEILVVCSGDDIYAEDRLKRTVEFFDAHPEIDVFYENFMVCDDQLSQGSPHEVGPMILEDYLTILPNGRANQTIPHGFSAYRRKVADAVPYDESREVGIDYPFFAEVAKQGFRFGFINDPGTKEKPKMGGGLCRVRPNSVTAQRQEEVRRGDAAVIA